MEIQRIPCIHAGHAVALIVPRNSIKHIVHRCSVCAARTVVAHPDLYWGVK